LAVGVLCGVCFVCSLGGFGLGWGGGGAANRQGRGIDHPPPSNAEIKERV
jgi:hypothetical protein